MTEPVSSKPPLSEAEKAEKAARKLESSRGHLEPGDRYKAQINAMKNAQDLIELGDRKARFALVIMSVLNAVLVLLVTRGGPSLFPRSGVRGLVLQVEVAAYVLVTVYYVFEAIQALRPRSVRHPPNMTLPSIVEPQKSMRVLFHADIAMRDREEYRALWDQLRMDNLTTELADALHALGNITKAKYQALDRLYVGLMRMTVLLAVILLTLGLGVVLN